MVWWHAADLRGSSRPPTTASVARRSVAASSRSGRRWRCTARRSSTRATSRRSWPTRSRAAHVCVYPFVRSYEWYLLEDSERRRMLAEHGKMARDYPDVRANTVASLRARRLRVDPGLRGRRAAPDRRPDARTCAPPTPAGTCARRCRSTPGSGVAPPSCSPACPEGRTAGREPARGRPASHRHEDSPLASPPCSALSPAAPRRRAEMRAVEPDRPRRRHPGGRAPPDAVPSPVCRAARSTTRASSR